MNKTLIQALAASTAGFWALEPIQGQQILAEVQARSNTLPAPSAEEIEARSYGRATSSDYDFPVVDGVAIISLTGPMFKCPEWYSYYGYCSTPYVRRQLAEAAADPDIKAVLLRVDSPGGSVAGTDELARDVATLAKLKPVHAYIEDCGASAAYWVASQASKLWLNPTGMAGSIGTYLWLVDSSKAFDELGFRVVLIATGEYKGAGAPGTVISSEQEEDFRRIVDDLNSHFLGSVARGRNLTSEQVAQVATGQVWIGAAAKKLGLVDEIGSLDQALATLVKATSSSRGARADAEVQPSAEEPQEPAAQVAEETVSGDSDDSPTGRTIAEESEAALTAVGGLTQREKAIAETRISQGRSPLSGEGRARIETTASALEGHAQALRGLLAETTPQSRADEDRRRRLRLAAS